MMERERQQSDSLADGQAPPRSRGASMPTTVGCLQCIASSMQPHIKERQRRRQDSTQVMVRVVSDPFGVHACTRRRYRLSTQAMVWVVPDPFGRAHAGGGYSYRLCPKASALSEDCFQKMPLQVGALSFQLFHCRSRIFPLPFLDLPFPSLDRSLHFHCLSLALSLPWIHCLSLP